MRYKIDDGIVKAEINSLGAELKSLIDIKTNEEFMWEANPEFWGRTSPVLFPIVGGLKDDTYTVENKEYKMTQHGFARDNEFVVVEQTQSEILFLLESTEETKKLYPFNFKLYIGYRLENGKVNIEYKVENISDEEILFSVGGHPAFATPITEEITYSDYYLEFEKKETAPRFALEGRNISRNTQEFLEDSKIIDLEKNTFENDALIFKDLDSVLVSLKCKKSKRVVTMDYTDFEYIAFWNVPGSQFVCLEPWNGIADFTDASGKLEEKDSIVKLESKKTYSVNLGLEIKA